MYSKFICSFNNTNTFTKTLFVVFSSSKREEDVIIWSWWNMIWFWMNENATPNIECHVNWYLFERSTFVPLGKFQFTKMHIKPKVKWRVVDSCISGYILQHKISFHCNAKAQKFIGFPFFYVFGKQTHNWSNCCEKQLALKVTIFMASWVAATRAKRFWGTNDAKGQLIPWGKLFEGALEWLRCPFEQFWQRLAGLTSSTNCPAQKCKIFTLRRRRGCYPSDWDL